MLWNYVMQTRIFNMYVNLITWDCNSVIVLLAVVGGDHSRITLRGLRRLDGMKSWIINKFV